MNTNGRGFLGRIYSNEGSGGSDGNDGGCGWRNGMWRERWLVGVWRQKWLDSGVLWVRNMGLIGEKVAESDCDSILWNMCLVFLGLMAVGGAC